MKARIRVVVESPYKGKVGRNEHYARRCMLHSLTKGEAPFLGHLLYPQVWDDSIPEERQGGIEAHCSWIVGCYMLVVYEDYGVSDGMQAAIDYAKQLGRPIEFRTIGVNP